MPSAGPPVTVEMKGRLAGLGAKPASSAASGPWMASMARLWKA